MITYIVGDVTYPNLPGPKILAHVVNQEGGWGAGVVVAISKRWKEPEAAYRHWYKTSGPLFALGEAQVVRVEDDLCVCNMLAQRGYFHAAKVNKIPLCYNALRTCLKKLSVEATKQGATIIMPKIGSGLAGGDWGKISSIIAQELDKNKVFVYTLD